MSDPTITILTEIRDTLSTTLANLPTPIYDSPIGHNIDYCIGQIEQLMASHFVTKFMTANTAGLLPPVGTPL